MAGNIRVYVVVEGGVVQAVYSNNPDLSVIIIDHDEPGEYTEDDLPDDVFDLPIN